MTEPLAIALPPETVEALVEPLVERVLARLQVGQEPHGAEWMTVEQAAEYAGRSVSAIRHLIDRRKLPKHQTVRGGRIMLRRSEIDACLGGPDQVGSSSLDRWSLSHRANLRRVVGSYFPRINGLGSS